MSQSALHSAAVNPDSGKKNEITVIKNPRIAGNVTEQLLHYSTRTISDFSEVLVLEVSGLFIDK